MTCYLPRYGVRAIATYRGLLVSQGRLAPRHVCSFPVRGITSETAPVFSLYPQASKALLTQLDGQVKRLEILEGVMSSQTMNPDELARQGKEQSHLRHIVDAYTEWKEGHKEMASLREMKADPSMKSDPELLQDIENDINALSDLILQRERTLVGILVPKETAHGASAILEIRAGTGGDEAALFAGDIMRMYQKHAELQRWKWEGVSINEDTIGGVKEAIVSLSGRGVFGNMRFESGVHRVQRVPATEAKGRVHTSTITVAVLPQPTDVDITIRDTDLRIDVYRSSGAGGQHVNTTDSAVRITHIPSGMVVAMQDERSQHKNKAKALRVLRARLYDIERERENSARQAARKEQTGSAGRSEKIRTYNYPQNRVTDHRIGRNFELDRVVVGEGLEEVMDDLRVEEEIQHLKSISGM